jgi:O-antigen/teichoic acid export membrane protein
VVKKSLGRKAVIVRNVFSNWTGYAVNLVVAFFLAPFVLHALGDSQYGIWVLVGSMTGYMGLLDFGTKPAIVKFASKYRALDQDAKINEIINSSLLVLCIAAGVVVVVSLVLASIAPSVFKVPEESYGLLRIIIVMIGINVAAGFPFGAFAATLNAFERFDLNNIIHISVLLMRALLIVVLLKAGGGLIALGSIVIFATLLEFSLRAYACKKVFPALKISFTFTNKQTLKMIYSFSAFTFLIGLAFQMSFYSSSIIIGAFISASAITFYAIASNLVEYLKNLVSSITITITPVASSLEAQGDFDRLKRLLLSGTKYCLLVIMPVGVAFIIIGEAFINLWMGPAYGPASSKVLTILMISYFGFLSSLVANCIFMGLGKIKALSLILLGTAVVTIILSIILVQYWGINGVAWGTTIPQIIYGMFIMPVYICRVLNIKLWHYIAHGCIPPLLAVIPFGAMVWWFQSSVIFTSLSQFFLYIIAASAVYGVIALTTCLESDHRAALWRAVRRMTARTAARPGE